MMESLLGGIEHYIGEYGYVAVFLGILLEDFGLPTPGETLLVSGAVAASLGKLDIKWLLLLAFLGAVIGDNIGFVIGQYGGHRLLVRYGRRVGITSERLKYVESYFDRYGEYIIIFARFFLILRQLNGICAGTLEMHWARFLLYNAIGAALWVGFWGMLAYWLGRNTFALIERVHGLLPLVLVVVALAIGAAILFHFLRRRT
ncbi:MAG TPA: DedA family protein [Stellaceae bacterium]|nr:DedA family protein [Stellaceae bacterium]